MGTEMSFKNVVHEKMKAGELKSAVDVFNFCVQEVSAAVKNNIERGAYETEEDIATAILEESVYRVDIFPAERQPLLWRDMVDSVDEQALYDSFRNHVNTPVSAVV